MNENVAREPSVSAAEGKEGAVYEFKAGSDKAPVDSKTGTEVREVTEVREAKVGEKLFIDAEQWKKHIEEEATHAEKEGNFARAAKLRGEKYDPDFGTSAKHGFVKFKNAFITVLVGGVLPGGAIVLMWEGIRFVFPKARKLPGLFKYKSPEQQASTPAKVVRLSARG